MPNIDFSAIISCVYATKLVVQSVYHSVSLSIHNTFPSRAVFAILLLPNHLRLMLLCTLHPPLPLPSPLSPLPPQKGAHHSCPTACEQFLRYCPCPIKGKGCRRGYTTPTPLPAPHITAPAQPHATYAGLCIRPCFLQSLYYHVV